MKRIILLSVFFVTTAGLLFSQTTAPKWMTEQTTKMMAMMEPELKLTKEQWQLVWLITRRFQVRILVPQHFDSLMLAQCRHSKRSSLKKNQNNNIVEVLP